MTPSEDKRSRLEETFSSVRSHLTRSKLKTILLVCLISFTSLLIRQTLQIQHSCNPMIYWSGELPSECKVAVENDFDNFNDFSSPTKKELKTSKQQSQIAQNTFESQPNQIIYDPSVTAVEHLQHNTKAESITPMEIAQEHPVETTIAAASLVVGAALTVAALPLIGIPVAIAGVGVAIFSIFH